MPEKESITWWAQIVRGLRPDEPWNVRPDTVLAIGQDLTHSQAPVTHAWATFTFKTFTDFVRTLAEVVNRVEAYHAGEDHITIEVKHGAKGWAFDLDLCIRDSAKTRSVAELLEQAPSDGDGAAITTAVSP
jgi:hypothetical protein